MSVTYFTQKTKCLIYVQSYRFKNKYAQLLHTILCLLNGEHYILDFVGHIHAQFNGISAAM